MRGVLRRVSVGAAGAICDSANPRDKSLSASCVRCNEDEREHSECGEENKFLSGDRGKLCVEEFR